MRSIVDVDFEISQCRVKLNELLMERTDILHESVGISQWDIWSEGYRATGESGTCMKLGTSKGRTFNEAVRSFSNASADKHLFSENLKGVWSYWGCRLFPDRESASLSFG